MEKGNSSLKAGVPDRSVSAVAPSAAWTADDLNAWHEALSAKVTGSYPVIDRLTCVDGYSVSIQANSGAYCFPRESRCWPYSSFEMGFPSVADEEIKTYAEDPEILTKTVYGWVPVHKILLVIAKHGGPSDAARAALTKAEG